MPDDRKYTQADVDQMLRAQQAFSSRRGDDDDDDEDEGSSWSWLTPLLVIGGLGGLAYGGYKLWPKIKGFIDAKVAEVRKGTENKAQEEVRNQTADAIEDAAKLAAKPGAKETAPVRYAANVFRWQDILKPWSNTAGRLGVYIGSGKAAADTRLAEQAGENLGHLKARAVRFGRRLNPTELKHMQEERDIILYGDNQTYTEWGQAVKDLFTPSKSILNPHNW